MTESVTWEVKKAKLATKGLLALCVIAMTEWIWELQSARKRTFEISMEGGGWKESATLNCS